MSRESIGRALEVHAVNGLIRSWQLLDQANPPQWLVRLRNGQSEVLRTTREAKVFCYGLASAHQAMLRLPDAHCACCTGNECECQGTKLEAGR